MAADETAAAPTQPHVEELQRQAHELRNSAAGQAARRELLTAQAQAAMVEPLPTSAPRYRDGKRDFSSTRKLVDFWVDDDYFTAPRELPAEIMADFVQRWESMDLDAPMDEQMKLLGELITMTLDEEPARVFIARMGDRKNPIGFVQVNDIVMWLMEEYGLRPTQQSDSSSPTPLPPASGTSSTPTPPAAASTSSPSP